MTAAGTTNLPSGTVTFLFTDIEGSTKLLQEAGSEFEGLLGAHAILMRQAISAHGGMEVRTEGDAFFCVFESALSAVEAAVAAQRAMAEYEWPESRTIRVRMGLHTGEGRPGGDDYIGLDVHRAARIGAVGHGGQIIISTTTRELVANDLTVGNSLTDLGKHHLKDIRHPEHLFQVDIAGLQSNFPPLRGVSGTPNNLPLQPTRFVGRRQELQAARDILADTSLLTITGPGGSGKTRFAVRMASEALAEFADGAFFVALDTITDHELIAAAIGGVLELPTATQSWEEIVVKSVAGSELLLLLDNFEHVLDGSGFIAEILRAAPAVKVLATSRAPLMISGERELPLAPLPTPGASDDADPEALLDVESVALFVDRAIAVRHSFALDVSNAAAVAEIVARLDGLPLAIELAAANIRLLPPAAIADRLRKDLGLRARGPRDLPERQRTLQDAIAWSYDLLDERVQRLLARMAVFSGGASLDDIDAVCTPAADLELDLFAGLETLVEQSLVRRVDDLVGARFTMLQTIRSFAFDRLSEAGELSEIRNRHADAYVALAEAAEAHLLGTDQAEWLDRLDLEHSNIRAALRVLVDEGRSDPAHRLAGALWRFWQIRGHLHEAKRWFDDVLALPDPGGRVRARALIAAGGVAYWRGFLEEAKPFYSGALDIYRALDDSPGIAEALYNMSFTFGYVDTETFAPEDRGAAREMLDEARELFVALGNNVGEASVRLQLGAIATNAHEYDTATEELTAAAEALRALGEPFHLGWALRSLGMVQFRSNGPEAAWPYLREALETHAASETISAFVLHFYDLAVLAVAEGDLERAAVLHAAGQKLAGESGTNLARVGFTDLITLEEALGNLDPDTAERARSTGQRMPIGEVVDYALRR